MAYSSLGHSSSFSSVSPWLHIHDLITFQVLSCFSTSYYMVKPKEHSSPGFYLTLIASAFCAGSSRLTVLAEHSRGSPLKGGRCLVTPGLSSIFQGMRQLSSSHPGSGNDNPLDNMSVLSAHPCASVPLDLLQEPPPRKLTPFLSLGIFYCLEHHRSWRDLLKC